jgi:hypothetical protein
MAACRFDQRWVTALVHRCPWFAHRLRTQHGPRGPVPSGRGRLRRSGPPRPGTDRPAGHGKADPSLRPIAHLRAKPDRAGSPPGQTTNGAGHGGRGIVRECPLATAPVRCEWHGSGTAGKEDGGGASQRRHQVDRRMRPVPVTPASLARAAGPRQGSGWDSNPLSGSSTSPSHTTGRLNLQVNAQRSCPQGIPGVPGAIRTQRGCSAFV